MVVRTCHSVGVQVVNEDINPTEYKTFLENRKKYLDERLQLYADKKAAKVLKSG